MVAIQAPKVSEGAEAPAWNYPTQDERAGRERPSQFDAGKDQRARAERHGIKFRCRHQRYCCVVEGNPQRLQTLPD